MIEISTEIKHKLFIKEAQNWAGIHEIGGNNRGQLVEIFLRRSGLPPGNPWCMAFVQFCREMVDGFLDTVGASDQISKMPRGAHCMTIWNTCLPDLKSSEPSVGSVVIWDHPGTANGHTGIVVFVSDDKSIFQTIEGNTSPGGAGDQRDGDGVYLKSHRTQPVSTPTALQIVGFINPWGK